jgi:hypothetical protein
MIKNIDELFDSEYQIYINRASYLHDNGCYLDKTEEELVTMILKTENTNI